MIKNYTTRSFRFFSLLIIILLSNFMQAQTTTWNGTVWDNGTPDITKDAVFTGNYTSTADVVTKSVSVSNAAQVIMAAGHTLTVQNNIDVVAGSNLIFENNASLYQVNALAVNTGNVNFKRNSTPIRQYEYTYWSSPVAGQTFVGYSPNTDSDRYHSFDTAANNWVNESPTNVMQQAKGYAIRVPDTFDPTTPQIFNGEFIGVPNNGDKTTNVVLFNPGLLNYNLLGNPYPSAISVHTLIDNSTLGTLYLWTHNTGITSNVFTSNDYAVRTRNTGTAALSGGAIPGAYIAAGQGFFASSSATGNITFTNNMRVANNNSQFFKNALLDPQYYYYRINVTNTGGAFKQIALGYEEGATNGYDFIQDAYATPGTPLRFYSLIGTDGFAIQGRAFPWTINDQISLGYVSTIAGDYEIALNDYDTFFTSQDIFIEDMNSGTFHNLKVSPYTFTTAIGTFDNRFKVHYVDLSLATNEYTVAANSVYVFSNNNEIAVNSSSEKIKSVQVYDVLGRLIFTKENINNNKLSINSIAQRNQALIIKTQLENNQVISKKLIF